MITRAEVTKVVNEWFSAQCLDAFSAFYLYFKPSDGAKAGEIKIAVDAPEGFELADPQRISPAWSTNKAEWFVWEKIQRLPICPVA
jgi:hypothetical protein